MKKFWYHARFAWHLWRNVPDMSWGEAWGYPIETCDGDPIEDARSEMSYMHE